MRTARLIAAWLPLLMLSLACGTSGPPEQHAEPAPSVTEPPPAPPPEPDHAFRRHDTQAFFENDTLTDCLDADLVVEPPDSVPEGWEVDMQRRFGEFGNQPVPDGASRLQRRCAEQFADRTVVARCTTQEARGPSEIAASITTTFVRQWYGTEPFENDHAMQSCIRRNGEWWRLDPESDEGLAVRQADAERRLQRLGQ